MLSIALARESKQLTVLASLAVYTVSDSRVAAQKIVKKLFFLFPLPFFPPSHSLLPPFLFSFPPPPLPLPPPVRPLILPPPLLFFSFLFLLLC